MVWLLCTAVADNEHVVSVSAYDKWVTLISRLKIYWLSEDAYIHQSFLFIIKHFFNSLLAFYSYRFYGFVWWGAYLKIGGDRDITMIEDSENYFYDVGKKINCYFKLTITICLLIFIKINSYIIGINLCLGSLIRRYNKKCN